MSVAINRFRSTDADFATKFDKLRAFEAAQNVDTDRKVSEILAAVRARKNAAVLEYTQRFDRWQPDAGAGATNSLEVSRSLAA